MNCTEKKLKYDIANVECCVNYLNINSFEELSNRNTGSKSKKQVCLHKEFTRIQPVYVEQEYDMEYFKGGMTIIHNGLYKDFLVMTIFPKMALVFSVELESCMEVDLVTIF